MRIFVGLFVFSCLFLVAGGPALAQDSAGTPAISAGDTAFVMISAALVLFMTVGLAFFYGGLVRRKNVLSILMHCFFIMGMISVQWVLFGYIRPDRLEEVKARLFEKEVYLMTVSEVIGCGRQKGVAQVYRGRKEAGGLLRKIKLEIAVNDDFVEPTIEAITGGARSGEIGDGKIFILNLEDCMWIRTGERGGKAIG